MAKKKSYIDDYLAIRADKVKEPHMTIADLCRRHKVPYNNYMQWSSRNPNKSVSTDAAPAPAQTTQEPMSARKEFIRALAEAAASDRSTIEIKLSLLIDRLKQDEYKHFKELYGEQIANRKFPRA